MSERQLSKANMQSDFNPSVEHPSIPFIKSCITSLKAGWNGIVLQRMELLPVESPVLTLVAQDALAIHHLGSVDLASRIEDKVYWGRSVPGNICLRPRDTQSEYFWNAPSTNIYLSFEPQLMAELSDDLRINDISRLTLLEQFNFRDPLIYQTALALNNELNSSGLLGRVYAESLGQTAALHLIRNYSNRSITRSQANLGLSWRQMRILDDFINDRLSHNISLADLAGCVGLSTYHFTRLFKKTTGQTPHQYLIYCRVERAKELVEENQLTLSEIAQLVGFVDQSHLGHHFKKLTGCSPRFLLLNSKNLPKEA